VLRPVAAAVECVGELVNFVPCAAKNDRSLRVLDIEDAAKRSGFVATTHHIGRLLDERHVVFVGGLLGDPYMQWIVEVMFDEVVNARGHRGGEQHCLAVGRCLAEDFFEVFGEAHVEHFVGLVQDDNADVLKLECAPLDVIDRPTRGSHDDVDAAPKLLQLLLDGLTTVDRQYTGTNASAVLVDCFRDLHGQFSCWNQDEGDGGDLVAVVLETLEDGEGECSRLAGTGGSLAKQIATRHNQRDCFGLNGRGFFVTLLGELIQDGIIEAKVSKQNAVGIGRFVDGLDNFFSFDGLVSHVGFVAQVGFGGRL